MPSANEHEPVKRPDPIRWEFAPEIPTLDFFEGRSLNDASVLHDAVESFTYSLETDDFLMWEAVVCQEQGRELTPAQREAISQLNSFDENPDDQILYIDELPRPRQPWHVLFRHIAEHLLIQDYRTDAMYYDAQAEGWDSIMSAVATNGAGLSLPPGVHSVQDIVPAELRHKLWLQYCLEILCGLGQEDELTLANPDQEFRIEELIVRLREYKETVVYFGLTINSLLTRIALPERDQPVFIKQMQEALSLGADEPLADRL